MDQVTDNIFKGIDDLAKKNGTPFKILIVDDEVWVRETFRDICQLTQAFVVDMAESGQQAIEKVAEGNYDLVTIDLIMPEISGLEVLEAIKGSKPRVPVMIITGNATDKLVREAGIKGASKVLYKPLDLTDFVAELTATIARQASRP